MIYWQLKLQDSCVSEIVIEPTIFLSHVLYSLRSKRVAKTDDLRAVMSHASALYLFKKVSQENYKCEGSWNFCIYSIYLSRWSEWSTLNDLCRCIFDVLRVKYFDDLHWAPGPTIVCHDTVNWATWPHKPQMVLPFYMDNHWYTAYLRNVVEVGNLRSWLSSRWAPWTY